MSLHCEAKKLSHRTARGCRSGSVLALFMIAMLICSVGQTSVLTDDDYNFPYRNPFLATILSVINRAALPFKTVRIDLHPERVNITGLPKDPSVELGLFEQKGKSAPLVFVIAGTGGGGLSGTALLLASQASKLGYHAITLPNPLSQEYVLGVSASTLPGYLPNDAKEYYDFLTQVVGMLESEHHMAITGFSVVGLSYGATLAGFLNHLDHQRHTFQFQKTVMLNPAMDVGYASATLDWYNGRSSSFYPQDRLNIFEKIHEVITALLGHLPETEGDANYTTAQVERLAIDNIEMQMVIGDTFREYLQRIVFTSQQIKDLGILHSQGSSARLREAKQTGFSDYIEKFVALSLGVKHEPNAIHQFIHNTSFYGLANELAHDPGAYVMENADDFLLQNGDVALLTRAFGARLYLYPRGGHIGNFRYAQNQKDFASIMGEPLATITSAARHFCRTSPAQVVGH